MQDGGDSVDGPELAAQLGELDLKLLPLAPVKQRGFLNAIDAIFGFVLRGDGANVSRIFETPLFERGAAGKLALCNMLRNILLTDADFLREFLLSRRFGHLTLFLDHGHNPFSAP